MKFLKLGPAFLSLAMLGAGADLRLIEAAKSGDARAVYALLEERVPVNAAEADGSTALHEAARYDPEYTLLYYPLNMDQLIGKVLGDPRWSGSTALHAPVISGQAGIVQFLVDHGAKVYAKTKTGWTQLMLAGGVFFANAKKEYPAAAAILTKAMTEQGLLAATPGR
jgi:ankyrin repeat protein